MMEQVPQSSPHRIELSEEEHQRMKDKAAFEDMFRKGILVQSEITRQQPIIVYQAVLDRHRDGPKAQVPVIVAHGFTETPRTLRELAWATVADGRRVITWGDPTGKDAGIDAGGGIRMSKVPRAIRRRQRNKATALTAMTRSLALELSGVTQVDVVGHSEGAVYAVAAALQHVEEQKKKGEKPAIRKMILMNPAGMMGKDSAHELALRALEERRAEEEILAENPDQKLVSDVTKKDRRRTFLHYPLESLKALKTLSRTQIHTMLKTLMDAGIEIAIIHGEEDKLFPTERMTRHIQEGKNVTTFHTVPGADHSGLLRSPTYVQEVVKLMNDMEQTSDDEARGDMHDVA